MDFRDRNRVSASILRAVVVAVNPIEEGLEMDLDVMELREEELKLVERLAEVRAYLKVLTPREEGDELTTKQAVALLDVDRSTLWRWRTAGKVREVGPGVYSRRQLLKLKKSQLKRGA